MFRANLVFADIDGHSDMPMARRATVLEAFWRTCESRKPFATDSYALSFFDIDNDSLMAGFSGMRGMELPSEVLLWTLRLRADLLRVDVPVSFGVALATRDQLDWQALPGFRPQLRTHVYFPDDIELRDGRVDRRRLVGDPLILAARLLALAKHTQTGIAYAFVPSDQPPLEGLVRLSERLAKEGHGSFSLGDAIRALPANHREWIERWRVDPYGLDDVALTS